MWVWLRVGWCLHGFAVVGVGVACGRVGVRGCVGSWVCGLVGVWVLVCVLHF